MESEIPSCQASLWLSYNWLYPFLLHLLQLDLLLGKEAIRELSKSWKVLNQQFCQELGVFHFKVIHYHFKASSEGKDNTNCNICVYLTYA